MIRLLLVHILAGAAFGLTSVAADRLVLCGMEEVFVISADAVPPAPKETGAGAAKEGEHAKDTGTAKPAPASTSISSPSISTAAGPEKLWSWRAKDRPELPEKLRAGFATTDEIKVMEGGSRMLITSSSGGCALVEYPSGKVLWYARVPNAHSIEALPGNLVVVASSVSKEGNRLILFDLARSNEPLCSTPLPSAHGVIWDAESKRLWALGFEELRRYEITGLPDSAAGAGAETSPAGGKTDAVPATSAASNESGASAGPGFRLEASFRWPGKDGHDLQAVPGSRDLVLSCEDGVWLFDRKTESFRPHPELGSKPEVKSVSPHPKTGRIVWTRAGGGEWWTREVRFLDPQAGIRLPEEKLYKVRWLTEER